MSEKATTVGGALAYGWSLLAANWRRLWGAMALNTLACAVYLAGVLTSDLALMGGGFVAASLTTLVLYGSIFRLAFGPQHGEAGEFKPSSVGIQWRRMEWRLLGASILTAVFLGFCAVLMIFGVGAIAIGILVSKGGSLPSVSTPQAFTAALGPDGVAAVRALVTLVMMIILFAGVRLMLALPATADSGKLAVLRTWTMTRGRVILLFVTVLAIELPLAVFNVLVVSGLNSGTTIGPAAAFAGAILLALPRGLIAAPVMIGALAAIYRRVDRVP